MSRRMKTLRKNDPKEYWKILNTGKSTKQPDIEFKELFNFFKDLNTLKETNEPENTLNFDPTITAKLNENINSPITKDEIFISLFSYSQIQWYREKQQHNNNITRLFTKYT